MHYFAFSEVLKSTLVINIFTLAVLGYKRLVYFYLINLTYINSKY